MAILLSILVVILLITFLVTSADSGILVMNTLASGGIDSAKAAWERITAGASLVQIYTGWIFEGPNLVPDILDGLTLQMEKHGFKNIKDAIGSEEPWK